MCVFFFKQKTAYEMRISDWSSDVCSSDLGGEARFDEQLGQLLAEPGILELLRRDIDREHDRRIPSLGDLHRLADHLQRQFADQPALLGHGDEAFGRDQSIFGRFPAHQHFETDQPPARDRSEEHTSELQSLMRISYAAFCLKKKQKTK